MDEFGITTVRYNSDHEQIIAVKTCNLKNVNVGDEFQETRIEVINNISNGYIYNTLFERPLWKLNFGARVEVIQVDGEYFIRTDGNKIKNDNLGELPEF